MKLKAYRKMIESAKKLPKELDGDSIINLHSIHNPKSAAIKAILTHALSDTEISKYDWCALYVGQYKRDFRQIKE